MPGLYSEHKDLNPEAFAKKFQLLDPKIIDELSPEAEPFFNPQA
jgi:hypothetical protein